MADYGAASGIGRRVIGALFDTPGAARQAIEDLVAAGVSRDSIAETGGQDAEAGTSTDGGRGFWASLKDFFLPDEDRLGYEEGLRRGGHLLTVQTDDAHYAQVVDILDRDGAVDMDDREAGWRSEGWSRVAGAIPASGLVAGSTLDAGVGAPIVPAEREPSAAGSPRAALDAGWRSDDSARSAALGTAPRLANRDHESGRARVRSYRLDDEADNTKVAPNADFGSRISEHMEVISADGQNLGQVDHLDGPDRIKLTKASSPDGQHHIVPFTWIDHVDQHVHLNRTLAEIKAGR